MKLARTDLILCFIFVLTFMLHGCTGSNNWAVPGASSNLTPTALITGPLAGNISDEGTSVTFAGTAQDSEDGTLSGTSLVWTSNIDGQIGTGLTFNIAALSRGAHVITLTATDRSGATGTASIAITVRTPWRDPQWGYRQQIRISSAMTQADQTNYPALIKITDPANPLFGNALSNGDDILFTDMDGINKLDHEIELYRDTGTEELAAWVRISNLSSSSDTILYMYYGNSGAANQENADAVWDGNFLGVWHLAEDPSISTDGDCGGGTKEVCDSTSNNVDGDSNGGMTSGDQVAGAVNGSLHFDGSNDYIDLSNAINITDNFTVEAWIKTGSIPPVWQPGDPDVHWRTFIGDRWEWQFEITDEDYYSSPRIIFRRWGPYRSVISATTILVDQWYYTAVTVTANNPWDWNNKNLKMYVNGLFDTEGPLQTPININLASNLYMARRINTDIDWFDGLIDEIRFSDIVRSPEWIEATYNNLNDPDTYLAFQTEEVY